MILDLWIVFMVLSFVLVFIGYWRQADVFKIVGWTFIFVFSFNILLGTLEYHSGDLILDDSTQITITKQYTNYQDNFLGMFLAVVSFFGFILTFYDMKAAKLQGGFDGAKRI
jgi:hypothetical protein